jgi:hypothetical protein
VSHDWTRGTRAEERSPSRGLDRVRCRDPWGRWFFLF